MGKLKNYVLATAGLVILGGAFQFVMPLQANTTLQVFLSR